MRDNSELERAHKIMARVEKEWNPAGGEAELTVSLFDALEALAEYLECVHTDTGDKL